MDDQTKEFLRKIYKDNGLNTDDIYHHKKHDFIVVTKSGIAKIKRVNHIHLTSYQIIVQPSLVVFEAKASIQDRSVIEYGEWNSSHAISTKYGLLPNYPVAVAKKRAESRAVLAIMGLGEKGIMSEDEINHLHDENSPANGEKIKEKPGQEKTNKFDDLLNS